MLQTIPSLVDDTADDAVSLELALIENIARADLTVIEEARTIASLLDDLNVPGPTSHAGSGEAAVTWRTPSAASSCPTRQSS